MTGRIWQIQEQTFTVPDINYVFQFSSVHSEEVAQGKEPPSHDNEIYFKMWDPTGTKCLTVTFDRNGRMVSTSLDDGEGLNTLQNQDGKPISGSDEATTAQLAESFGVAPIGGTYDPRAQERAEDHTYHNVQPTPIDPVNPVLVPGLVMGDGF